MLKKFRSFDGWSKLVVLFLWGSVFLGKASAYVGLAFGVLLLFSTRVLWDRWYVALTRRGDPLYGVAWAILVSMVYGIAQTIYGVLLGYPIFTVLQILVFNICPVYLFLGIWVGFRHPGTVQIYNRFNAWFTVFYTPIYFIFLRNLHLSLSGILPGTGLDLLGNPGSGSVTLLGLLAFEPNLVRFWLPIVVLSCLTIALQERADWVGLVLCLLVWGKITNKIGRVLAIAGSITGVLLIASLIDLKLPPLPGRGGELSARGTITRMAGSISPGLASEFGADAATARFAYGTVYWRTHWWSAIRNEVTKDNKTMIFGLGYGYPLARLASRDVEKQGTRSPHSIYYFALAYSGILGVAIFFWLEICMIRLLWRVYKVTGQTFGLIYFLYCLSSSFFGNFIETPQGGIQMYLLSGLLAGPMFLQMYSAERAEETEPSQVAGLV
jgi:O-Antigen ligase